MKYLENLSFINNLAANLNSGSNFIQVIIGPRQVGKTTSVARFFEKTYSNKFIYESADQVFNSNAQWLMVLWQKALEENKILIIDEIQKCENWSEVIKKLWDESKKNKKIFKCVLLGSSSLEIQKGLSESLTGRFQLIKAFHWNYHDSKKAYGLNFDEYLKFGGYPGSYPLIKSKDWVSYVKNSIISTVVEKDILQYQKVKSPSLFRQAFEILVSYPAQEISYTKLLGQIQDKGNVDLVKYYISLFEGAFLMKALEKYSEKKIKIKASSPKILPLAPCLYFLNILDNYKPDEKGRAFELVVGAQLVRTDHELYYWREGNHEVDFVLKVGRKLFAIEVKSGRKRSTQGLDKFKSTFPHAKSVFITTDNYQLFESDPLAFLEKAAL